MIAGITASRRKPAVGNVSAYGYVVFVASGSNAFAGSYLDVNAANWEALYGQTFGKGLGVFAVAATSPGNTGVQSTAVFPQFLITDRFNLVAGANWSGSSLGICKMDIEFLDASNAVVYALRIEFTSRDTTRMYRGPNLAALTAVPFVSSGGWSFLPSGDLTFTNASMSWTPTGGEWNVAPWTQSGLAMTTVKSLRISSVQSAYFGESQGTNLVRLRRFAA